MDLNERKTFYHRRFDNLNSEYPSFRADASWTVILLAWAHDSLMKELSNSLAKHNLSLAAFNVLAILHERKQVPLNELSKLLVRTAANITGLVDGLVKRGLVRRVAHSEDRRIKLAELSKSGLSLIAQVIPEYQASVNSIFKHLDDDKVSTINSLLKELLNSTLEIEKAANI